MPYRRSGVGRAKHVRTTRRRFRRKRFMPKSLAYKRANNVDTKVFYFKSNGKFIQPLNATHQWTAFKSEEILTNMMLNWVQFSAVQRIYDEYKVLAMRVKFFPSSYMLDNSTNFNRGNTITWVDQQYDDGTQDPTEVSHVINDSSAKMRKPYSSFTSYLRRARGFPAWGKLNPQQQPPQIDDQLDPWNGCINILVDEVTPSTSPSASRTLYYWVWTMKVLFRGRTT